MPVARAGDRNVSRGNRCLKLKPVDSSKRTVNDLMDVNETGKKYHGNYATRQSKLARKIQPCDSQILVLERIDSYLALSNGN